MLLRQSGCPLERGLVGEAVGVVEERAVDDVGEASSQSSYRFGAGVARFLASLQVGAGVRVVVGLRDGDAVQGCVELPVASAGESVPLAVA